MTTEIQKFDNTASNQLATGNETASSFVAAEAKAMVEARYVVAMRYPRNDDLVRQKLLKECRRTSFANVAIYSKPVGGKKMEGPSIRFAEAILRMMGNVSIDVKVLFDDREKRIVRVTITDFETNYPITQDVTIEKTMERRDVKATDVVISSRLNSNGQTVHLLEANEDAVATKQAAMISKAIRSQGLRMVPGDLIDEAMTIVRATQAAADYQDPDGARNTLLDAFADIGVTAKQISVWLGHDTSAFTPKELTDLRLIFRAIKDGDSSWREVMEAKAETDGSNQGTTEAKPTVTKASKLRNAVKPDKAEPELAAAAGGGASGMSAQEVHDALVAATDRTSVDEAGALINMVEPPIDRDDLMALYNKRSKEIDDAAAGK